MDEYGKDALNEKLRLVADRTYEHPEVTITCFRPDEKKDGGAYAALTGCVKKIDEYEGMVCMIDGTSLSVVNIGGRNG